MNMIKKHKNIIKNIYTENLNGEILCIEEKAKISF